MQRFKIAAKALACLLLTPLLAHAGPLGKSHTFTFSSAAVDCAKSGPATSPFAVCAKGTKAPAAKAPAPVVAPPTVAAAPIVPIPAPTAAPVPGIQYDTRIGLGADANGVPLLTKSVNAKYVYWNPAHANASDANAGTDPTAPKRTLKSAWAALRDGFGDWLLMAQGANSTEGFSNLAPRSGLSAQYPIVVTTYDAAAPTDVSKMRQGMVTLGTKPTDSLLDLGDPRAANKTVFENITFDKPAVGDWAVAGLGTVQKDLMFFNVRFLRTNVAFQGDFSGNLVAARMSNIVFRRCVFAYAYSPFGHAQGLYLWTTNGVTVEDSIFYHNGWQGVDRNAAYSDAGAHADGFKHGAYFGTLTENTIFRRNVSAHNSSHGLQLRGGGVVTDNVFAGNPINVSVGGGDNYNFYRPTGVPYTFTNNVIVGSGNIDAANPRGFGVVFMNTQSSGNASGNIVANVGTNSTANLFAFAPSASFDQLTFVNWSNNIQWNWGTNSLASYTQDIGYNPHPVKTIVTRTGNIVDSERADGNLTAPEVAFPNPQRSVATFATSQGFASEAAFYTYAIQHPEISWSAKIGDYIRAGFGK